MYDAWPSLHVRYLVSMPFISAEVGYSVLHSSQMLHVLSSIVHLPSLLNSDDGDFGCEGGGAPGHGVYAVSQLGLV